MINHILIPVDFSQPAETAAQYGFVMAARLAARVTLLHVMSPAIVALPEATYVPTEEERRAVADVARAQLRALAFRHTRAGVHAECVAVEGTPVEAIDDYAASHHIDLIIMGTHGRRGFTHALLGSVAERVVRSAPCPVLTVGREAAREALAAAH